MTVNVNKFHLKTAGSASLARALWQYLCPTFSTKRVHGQFQIAGHVIEDGGSKANQQAHQSIIYPKLKQL